MLGQSISSKRLRSQAVNVTPTKSQGGPPHGTISESLRFSNVSFHVVDSKTFPRTRGGFPDRDDQPRVASDNRYPHADAQQPAKRGTSQKVPSSNAAARPVVVAMVNGRDIPRGDFLLNVLIVTEKPFSKQFSTNESSSRRVLAKAFWFPQKTSMMTSIPCQKDLMCLATDGLN